MQTERDYASIVKRIRFPLNEIAKRAGLTSTTIASVLKLRSSNYYSQSTERKVHAVIDHEVKDLRKYLNRLSNGATGD